MERQDKQKFFAVAFDLDGTLYPNHRFYRQVLPFVLKNFTLVRTFGKVRNRLHREAIEESAQDDSALPGSYYQRQARYMGEILKTDPALMLEKIEKAIYRGWEPLFKKVRLFPHAVETLKALRERGIKLALLSDFPPEAKIENLELSGFWDAVLCSETIGRLKPHPLSFQKTAEALALPPQEILYVGNSFSFDVVGAQKAGMKAAWIRPRALCSRFFTPKEKKADFIFYDYRQLRDFVLT